MATHKDEWLLFLTEKSTPEDVKKIEALAMAKFDHDSDRDNAATLISSEYERFLRAQVVIKLIIFPALFMLTLMIQGMKEAMATYEVHKCYVLYLRRKMTSADISVIQSVATSEMISRIKDNAHVRYNRKR